MHLLKILGYFILALTLASCGDDPLDSSVDPTADPDEDGLTNSQEINTYFTNTTVADTDGDGISDGDEVNELGFNPAANLYRFNPMIADLPSISITVETIPDLVLRYTDTVGGENTTSNASGGETVISDTTSHTEGVSATVSIETEISFTPSATVSASVTGSFEATQEHSRENHETWETVTENSSSTSRETGDATLRVGVSIANNSNLTYSLEHLTLAASYYDGSTNTLKPIATLGYDNAGSGFQTTSFAPGESSTTLLFSFDSLDLGTALDVLKDMRSMSIEPALFEITGIDGTPIDFNVGEVTAKTAVVLIDYGIVRPQETYNVSMLSSLGNGSLTVSDILTIILQVPFTESGGLQTVREVGGDTASRWIVHVVHNDGFFNNVTVYDPESESYDSASIEIYPSDQVRIIYLTDPDGDGAGIREEILSGTDPNMEDTDGDGLSDEIEIRTSFLVNSVNLVEPDRYPAYVKSNPLLADADNDGLNDLQERERGLDPNNADTDADGISDFTDTFNGQLPVAADFKITPTGNISIHLTGTATPKAGTRVTSIAVDWGDTTTDTINSTSTTPLNININHTYPAITADSDSYTITITTSSDDDDPNTVEAPVTHIGSVEIYTENTLAAYGVGWAENRHIRGVADLDGDGDGDLFGFGEVDVQVSLWDETTNTYTTANPWLTGTYGVATGAGGFDRRNHPRFIVDYDNDGLNDIVAFASASVIWSRNCPGDSEFKASAACGNATDTTLTEIVANGFGTNGGWSPDSHIRAIADVDGNGFLDIVGIGSSATVVARNNGDNTTTLAETNSSAFTTSDGWNNGNYYRFVKDINNDGRADIIGFGNGGGAYALGQIDGTFGTAVEFCQTGAACITYENGWRPTLHPVYIEDVNNDSLPDIVGIGYGGVVVILNESVGNNIAFSNVSKVWSANYDYNDGWRLALNQHPRFLADINNDGYKDIIGFSWSVVASLNQLSEGVESFSTSIATLSSNIATNINWASGGLYNSRYAADYNNDGRVDVVGFGNAGVVAQRTPVIVQPVEQ